MSIVNSLQALEILVKDPFKSFEMVNYNELKKIYGNQILHNKIINFAGKVCYEIEDLPTVKLSYCFLNLALWKYAE